MQPPPMRSLRWSSALFLLGVHGALGLFILQAHRQYFLVTAKHSLFATQTAPRDVGKLFELILAE